MNIVTILLSIIDFIIGFTFGSLGHFFSLFCFPFQAILRGGVTLLSIRGIKNIIPFKSGIASGLLGSVSFYVGMMLGVLNLIFIMTPNIDTLQQGTLGNTFDNPAGIIGGIGGGVFCGLLYVLIYMLIVVGIVSIFGETKK